MQNRRSFDLDRAEDMLDALLDKHDRNLDLAKGFGVRTAALPKGLMPLKQAQQIVASFESDTKQLNAFVNSLHAAGKAPAGMEAEFKALLNKATLALGKFEVDRSNATKAIEKYEDLLVGEHFQTAFEAVRHAVLDFDFNSGTNDWTQIAGTLTLPASATLRVRTLDGSFRSTVTVLQATAITGNASAWSPVMVNGWKYRAVVSGNQLQLQRAQIGTAILVH